MTTNLVSKKRSYSCDDLNQFVIENFLPYAWSGLWEQTEPESWNSVNGYFDFLMTVRPNLSHNKYSYGNITYQTYSSNSLTLEDDSLVKDNVIKIPMIKGNAITKNGIPLDDDHRLKYIYAGWLAKYTVSQIEILDPECCYQIDNPREIFGDNKDKDPDGDPWWRFNSYLNGNDISEWSFLQNHSNSIRMRYTPEEVPFHQLVDKHPQMDITPVMYKQLRSLSNV